MRIETLSFGKWKAIVAPDYAMNVLSLTCEGEPVLRTPEKLEELEKMPFVYGTPLLIPPNKTTEDSFLFDGKTYTIPYPPGRRRNQHGLLYHAPMNLVEKTPERICGVFDSTEERYPFPFRLEITAALDADGLKQSFVITNTGTGAMPLLFGLHTTFAATDRFTCSIGRSWLRDWETGEMHGLGQLNEEQKLYVTGCCPVGANRSGSFVDSGLHEATIGRYRYRVSDNFTHWVIWNKGGNDGFISLEPQSGAIDGLRIPGQYLRLEPGESERFETRISKRV